MCVFGGSAVPEGGGVGDRHLAAVPQWVAGDHLPWGGAGQEWGGYSAKDRDDSRSRSCSRSLGGQFLTSSGRASLLLHESRFACFGRPAASKLNAQV